MSDNSDHLKKASESIRDGLFAVLKGLYHSFYGFSEFVKERHIIVQTGITGAIFIGLAQVANVVGSSIFTTFWGQAAYISGIKLRLIPVPLSLVIYLLILSFLLLGFSLDSSIRNLQSDIDELRSELEEVKDDTNQIEE